jgi:hypothetical protein
LLLQYYRSLGESIYSFKERSFKTIHDYFFLCLLANDLASALLLNPHRLSASANLVGLDLVPILPLMLPNLAAKLILRGDVPDLNGALNLAPVVLLKKFLPR